MKFLTSVGYYTLMSARFWAQTLVLIAVKYFSWAVFCMLVGGGVYVLGNTIPECPKGFFVLTLLVFFGWIFSLVFRRRGCKSQREQKMQKN